MSTCTSITTVMPGTRISRRPHILVAGLGNLLLADDGVGVHAVRGLARRVPAGVRAVEIGTAVLDALHLIERADKLLAIDAMQAGGRPGEIYSFALDDVANPPAKPSLHDFGLRAAFDFLPGRRPDVLVLGVEPARIELGLDLSPEVSAALSGVIEAALRMIEGWRADDPQSTIHVSPSTP